MPIRIRFRRPVRSGGGKARWEGVGIRSGVYTPRPGARNLILNRGGGAGSLNLRPDDELKAPTAARATRRGMRKSRFTEEQIFRNSQGLDRNLGRPD